MSRENNARNKNISYNDKWRLIKQHVNFEFPVDGRKNLQKLPSAHKRIINACFNDLSELQARQHTPIVIRGKKKRAIANEYSGQTNKRIKTTFIPSKDIITNLQFSKNAMTVTTKTDITYFVPFDKKALPMTTHKECMRVLKKIPKKMRSLVKIKCGKFEIYYPYSPNTLYNKIKKLMDKYDNQESNNYWGNWLDGVTGVKFKGGKKAQTNRKHREEHFEAKRQKQLRSQKCIVGLKAQKTEIEKQIKHYVKNKPHTKINNAIKREYRNEIVKINQKIKKAKK